MSDLKKYSVIELAELLSVPRTTVNDWLSRYAQYINFKIQGKRKIYTDDTLSVLKEISELRNQNLSSFDIEEELAKRHPVNAEVAQPESEIKTQSAAASSPQPQVSAERQNLSAVTDSNQPSKEEFGIIAKKQTDEIARIISENLQNMLVRIQTMEEFNKQEVRRKKRWFAISLAFAAILFAVISIFILKLNLFFDQNKALAEENKKISSELSAKSEEMKKLLISIKKENDEKREAELLKLREKMAEERLNGLKLLLDKTCTEGMRDDIINKLKQDEQPAILIKNPEHPGAVSIKTTEESKGDK